MPVAPQWVPMNGNKDLSGECTHKTAKLASKSDWAGSLSRDPFPPVPHFCFFSFLFSLIYSPILLLPLLSSPKYNCDTRRRNRSESPKITVLVTYLPAGLLPDPVLPLWTEQSLTGPHPCPESCDHVCALPKVQRWPWWTPAFTFSSAKRNKKHSGP